MTHTPGPWKARPKFRSIGALWNERRSVFERIVAYLPTWGYDYDPFAEHSTDPEMVANACLIAAAPELLELVHEAYSYLDPIDFGDDTEGEDLVIKLMDVIAKVRGE